ncbi:MAG TPA: hypothetical protein VFW76_09655, partial [Ktedonobacterales bacterium]|nr:hypothetical protein [Ktedonobacterales bacterium]
MPSRRPPYDDGSTRATDERTADEKRQQAPRRPQMTPDAPMPKPRAHNDGESGVDPWATFRGSKVTDGPITGNFTVDVAGMPTMQLPALPSALPREIFPAPVWKLPQRRQAAIEWEEKAGLAPKTTRYPSWEEGLAEGTKDETAIDDLPTWVLPAIPAPAETEEAADEEEPAPAVKRRRFGLGRGLDGYFGLVGGLLKSS